MLRENHNNNKNQCVSTTHHKISKTIRYPKIIFIFPQNLQMDANSPDTATVRNILVCFLAKRRITQSVLTHYGLVRVSIHGTVEFAAPLQTGPGAHSISHTGGTRLFPE